MKWYAHDPSAALAGMIGLTIEERGAYYTLIDLAYARAPNGHVTDELVIAALNVRPQVWRRLKAVLIEKGKLRDVEGKLVANRVETEVKLASNRQGLTPSLEDRSEQKQQVKGGTTTTTPTTTKKESPSDSPAVAVATRPAIVFEEFWKAYPGREGSNPKDPALKAFSAALKAGATAEEIIAGAKACAAKDRDKVGTKFIPQAVTWLHQRRWRDYGESAPPGATGFDPNETSAQRIARYQAEHFGNGTGREATGAGQQHSGLGETGPGDDPEFRFESGMDHAGHQQGPASSAIRAASRKLQVR